LAIHRLWCGASGKSVGSNVSDCFWHPAPVVSANAGLASLPFGVAGDKLQIPAVLSLLAAK